MELHCRSVVAACKQKHDVDWRDQKVVTSTTISIRTSCQMWLMRMATWQKGPDPVNKPIKTVIPLITSSRLHLVLCSAFEPAHASDTTGKIIFAECHSFKKKKIFAECPMVCCNQSGTRKTCLFVSLQSAREKTLSKALVCRLFFFFSTRQREIQNTFQSSKLIQVKKFSTTKSYNFSRSTTYNVIHKIYISHIV